jgi:hypothetical protein
VSFLSHLRTAGVNGPFLIIGPLSTLRNWSGEVKRWCPSMPVLEYHGSGAKARAELRAKHMPINTAGERPPAAPHRAQDVVTARGCNTGTQQNVRHNLYSACLQQASLTVGVTLLFLCVTFPPSPPPCPPARRPC